MQERLIATVLYRNYVHYRDKTICTNPLPLKQGGESVEKKVD